MATELRRVIQFDGIVVAQYDEASNEILWNACEICRHQGPITPPDIPADETITKWVCERQEPLVIPSLADEARFPRMNAFLREQGFQSLCALPLTTVHRRIGSIAVASKHPDSYCAEEVRFLSLVADQVALAIDDALNFQVVAGRAGGPGAQDRSPQAASRSQQHDRLQSRTAGTAARHLRQSAVPHALRRGRRSAA